MKSYFGFVVAGVAVAGACTVYVPEKRVASLGEPDSGCSGFYCPEVPACDGGDASCPGEPVESGAEGGGGSPTTTCPRYATYDAKTYRCECTPGFVFNATKTACVCPPDQVLDPKTYACVCPPGTELVAGKCLPVCGDLEVRNPTTCECDCKAPLVRNGTHACVCPSGSPPDANGNCSTCTGPGYCP